MFGGWSQLNENLQGDFSILQQISALRRENRFLKVGLIFCLVLSALPYLTGFQPTVIRASKVVTERIEFVRDGKTVMSIVAHPKADGLVIQDKNNLPVVRVYRSPYGGSVGVFDRRGKIAAGIGSLPKGGALVAYNEDVKAVAIMGAQPKGGILSVHNKDGKPVAIMIALSDGGSISLRDNKMHELIAVEATPLGGTIEIKAPSGQTLWSTP